MTDAAETLVADATRQLDDVPDAFISNVARQHGNLHNLATRLLNAGFEEVAVRAVVTHAYASYRDELIGSILAIREQDHVA